MINLTFPGENTIKISREAIMQMLQDALQSQLGAGIRVTGVDYPSNYGSSPMSVDFTTDAPRAIPEAAPRVPTPERPDVVVVDVTDSMAPKDFL